MKTCGAVDCDFEARQHALLLRRSKLEALGFAWIRREEDHLHLVIGEAYLCLDHAEWLVEIAPALGLLLECEDYTEE